jgi:hypothetical protein
MVDRIGRSRTQSRWQKQSVSDSAPFQAVVSFAGARPDPRSSFMKAQRFAMIVAVVLGVSACGHEARLPVSAGTGPDL